VLGISCEKMHVYKIDWKCNYTFSHGATLKVLVDLEDGLVEFLKDGKRICWSKQLTNIEGYDQHGNNSNLKLGIFNYYKDNQVLIKNIIH